MGSKTPSLAEQSTSTAALLDQPARTATPVILPPVLSTGPEPVTDEERAQERVQQRATKRACHTEETSSPKNLKAKKVKPVPPELAERQVRASVRMAELGVPPLEVSILVTLIKV